jgi:hypothetical protein
MLEKDLKDLIELVEERYRLQATWERYRYKDISDLTEVFGRAIVKRKLWDLWIELNSLNARIETRIAHATGGAQA